MGRKKTSAPTKPGFVDKRVTIMAYKGLPGYRDWLKNVTKRARIPAAVLVDQLLARWAIDQGYPEPPER
jgi:hypothetical protein